MTRTRLPDGRIVCVAGEHEDYYDPDFCIYNDVIVLGTSGEVTIFGYPEEVFPPTDFHSATRAGGRLILVGGLGYAGRRAYGQTPVYALDLATFAMQPLQTSGDAPGWIHQHHASLEPDGRALRISGGEVARAGADGKERHEDNARVFRLHLETLQWTASEGPWLEPPLPDCDWPAGWRPIRSQQESRDVADGLSRSVSPEHPLFADDYTPISQTGDAALTVLLRSRTDPDLFVVSEGPTWTGRSEEALKFETYRGLETWRQAAEGRSERWWH
jgi:hypothetical protein